LNALCHEAIVAVRDDEVEVDVGELAEEIASGVVPGPAPDEDGD